MWAGQRLFRWARANPSDVRCARLDASQLSGEPGSSGTFLHLTSPETRLSKGDPLLVAGYPDDSRRVDYERMKISVTLEELAGRYVGPSVSTGCYEMELTDVGSITEASGFSGSPVFRVQKLPDGTADVRLVGMVIRGTIASRRLHFIDVAVLRRMARKVQES